ncbi:MAG: ABC transporter permease [Legionellales bacterium]|nr:ABC transporter permease [Legionellales bacterium]
MQLQYLISLYTLLRSELLRVLRIWPQTIFPPVITSTLYYLIFGKLIGSRIGYMSGIDYIIFISPGLIIMNLIVNSYMNVVSSFYYARFSKCIEELLVSPTPNIYILLGYILAGTIRGMIVGSLVLIVSLFFIPIKIYSILLTIIVAFLASFLMSLLGFLNGLFARTFDDTTIISTFLLTPLIYLGGIFFTTSLLPSPWGTISTLNPVLHIVNAFRYSMIGITDINVLNAIITIIIVCVLAFIICLYFLEKGYGIRK